MSAATSSTNDLATLLTDIKAGQEAISKRFDDMGKNSDARTRGPFVRSGESALTSRGFQMCRVVGLILNKIPKEMAKVEIDLCQRTAKEYVERGLYTKDAAGSMVLPLSSQLMCEAHPDMETFAREVAEVLSAGVAGADPHEMTRLHKQFYGGRQKALNWQDESGLGVFVGPPVQGEPIELLRNQEIFMRAGARVVPFPPSGRIMWPRMTGSTTGYWVGTGTSSRTITASEPTSGDLVLQAKKLGVKVDVPNELFRFPSVSVEQLLRADMMKTAALTLDKSLLEAVGSQLEPKGLINYPNILTHTPRTVTADGNRLEAEDILEIIAKVEEENGVFGAWVGRPLLYAALANRRADAVTAGDRKGQFLFNMLREMQPGNADVTNNSVGSLEGYPFYKSNQISKTREKGSSTNLSYLLGGDFTKMMVALSGVMEMLVTNVGDTNFADDKSSIRLITWADAAPEYEESFIWVDDLYLN